MIMSNKAKCAFRVMVYLATSTQNTMTIQEIYSKEIVSKRYLEQVFADLKHHGLITSVKGKKGGYFLAKTSEQITAKDLVLAVDEPLFSTEGNSFYIKNELEEILDTHLWDPLHQHVLSYLESITLDTLIATYNENYNHMFYI